jgi:hypothetical protein
VTCSLSPLPVRSTFYGLMAFCVATYGARLYLFSYPPFRLRMRSPSGWANFATRLRR